MGVDGSRETGSQEVGETDLERGRYLYCVVDLAGVDPDEHEFSGIDDELAYVVEVGDIGAVVHPCQSLYDSRDLRQLQEWLLAHQRVVDDAGEAFGTPLPFRFDTVIRGDDETVREWLRSSAGELGEILSEFAGTWEYRIRLNWDEDRLTELALEGDDELAAAQPDDEAGEGTAYLQRKQFEQRLAEARRAHRESLAAEVEETLGDHAIEVEPVTDTTARQFGASGEDSFARFALRTQEERVDAIGDYLDQVANRPGLTVTFTGPWPPYSFVPELGGEE